MSSPGAPGVSAPLLAKDQAITEKPPLSFRKTLLWVAATHFLIFLAIVLWSWCGPRLIVPGDASPMELIAVPGPIAPPASAGQAPPAPTPPAPTPTPPQPQEEQEPETATPPPVAETPPSEPEPKAPAPSVPTPTPIPSAIHLPPKPTASTAKPKPALPPKPKLHTPPAKPAPTPAPPHPHVSLTEVNRSAVISSHSPAKHTNATSTQAQTPGLEAGGVSSQLSKALIGAGVENRIVTGPTGGSPDGGAGNGWYYDLIRQQMYAAWDQPTELAGKNLRARIQIKVEKDGTIIQCTLLTSSGNAIFDKGALAAAQRVPKISQPRPDGLLDTVVINFRLAE